MNKHLIIALCACLLDLFIVSAQAQTPAAVSSNSWVPSATAVVKPQVLVIGTYHMANPDLDFADPNAPNDLTPHRQAQLRQVVDVLEHFRPTEIAVERPPGDPQLAANYAEYLDGKLPPDRNEIVQLGFRLAKELGLKTVYGADAPHQFPLNQVQQYAKSNHETQQPNAILNTAKEEAKELTSYLDTHTILQTLALLNSDSYVKNMVSPYYLIAHFSKPKDWAGPDAVSLWYRRNLRIYANVINLIRSPHSRVLVIFGYGHLGWLRHDFASDPTVQLRTLAEFMTPDQPNA